MGDLRRSSLRRENVEEDREEQAKEERRNPFGTRHVEKIKSVDARDAPWDSLSFCRMLIFI